MLTSKACMNTKRRNEIIDEDLVDEAFCNGAIDKDACEFIITSHPRIPTLYCLPKIHKDLKIPPGHPIISGNGSITENLSKFIDSYLRPFVTNLPSYIKDTIHQTMIISKRQKNPLGSMANFPFK